MCGCVHAVWAWLCVHGYNCMFIMTAIITHKCNSLETIKMCACNNDCHCRLIYTARPGWCGAH